MRLWWRGPAGLDTPPTKDPLASPHPRSVSPRQTRRGRFQVRHQRTQPLGSGPHGPPSSCPQRVCVQWCTPTLSPLGSPVVCRGVRFLFDGAGPCSQPAPPLPHAPEFVFYVCKQSENAATPPLVLRPNNCKLVWGHLPKALKQLQTSLGKLKTISKQLQTISKQFPNNCKQFPNNF